MITPFLSFIIFFNLSFIVPRDVSTGLLVPSLSEVRPSYKNTDCLRCHGQDSSLPATLKIDEAAFASSAHASLSCLECHKTTLQENIARPHEEKIPAPDCISTCHLHPEEIKTGKSPVFYKDSVHGRAFLERGEKEVARCWDCHGKHNILPAKNPASAVHRANIPRTCSICHENMAVVVKYHIHAEAPYHEYLQSVHGKAVYLKGLVSFAAICTDCHGVHNIQGPGDPNLMAKQPATCGNCHELIYASYKESIHGQLALKGDPYAPLCVDCHGEHRIISPSETASSVFRQNIPQTCAQCHARPDVMKRYGVPADRVSTFIESLHGIALTFGVKGVATCVTCHGAHDILPAADPRSHVHPLNLTKTCSQGGCHPDMPQSLARTKIHVGLSAQQPKILRHLELILIILVLITISLTIIFIVPGLWRRFRLIFKKK